jgi:hypothetical protein
VKRVRLTLASRGSEASEGEFGRGSESVVQTRYSAPAKIKDIGLI